MSDAFGAIVSIMILLTFLFGAFIGNLVTGEHYKQVAVERGFAHYCPKKGNWQWNEKESTEKKEEK